ncbi:MAG: hypothetical protein WCG28_04310 [bacterium]
MNRLEVFASYVLESVPGFFSLKMFAMKKWGTETVNIEPSFVPENGDEIIFFTPKVKKGGHAHSHEVIEAVKAAGFFFAKCFWARVSTKPYH